MQRGEIWFAAVPGGGNRPVLILTRDPVADRIAATTTVRLFVPQLLSLPPRPALFTVW